MFILDPDPYLLPAYRISPFTTEYISINNKLPDDNYALEYFDDRFRGNKYYLTYNGRRALFLALSAYNLKKEDVVTILTTTGNYYISGCVTGVIEKFCRWSRKIEKKTKIIVVNHEFGFPFEGLVEIKKLGIPVIEDCAHSFFSADTKNYIGKVGDYVVFSFPKMFPVQFGGLLLSNVEHSDVRDEMVHQGLSKYLINVLSFHLKRRDEIIRKRLENYHSLSSLLSKLNLLERFKVKKGVVPGVFMFRTGDYEFETQKLKDHYYCHGIQNSVFYGEKSFFIPVHQGLKEEDLLYFFEVTRLFLERIE